MVKIFDKSGPEADPPPLGEDSGVSGSTGALAGKGLGAMSFDVGSRLRTLRERFSLSQRELAKRAGVTNSTISLIEQNRVSPSVASLKKVLDGLPLSLGEFFAGDEPPRRQVFYGVADMTELTFDAICYRLVGGGAAAGRRLTIMHETYGPQADTGEPLLSYEGEEGGIIVAGALELTVGEEVRLLTPGEGYYFDTAIPHRFRNPGTVPCAVITGSTTTIFRKTPRGTGSHEDGGETS